MSRRNGGLPVFRPVARTEGLLIEEIGAETVIYDSESREAHCLTPLAAAVFGSCDGQRTIEELATAASERLGEPVETARVQDALAQLEERALMGPSASEVLISRRQMIKKSAAAGGAVASVPLIMTVATPIAHAAVTASCGTPGASNAVICCPCGTGGPDTGKQSCCSVPGVTENCVCVSAQGNASKFCKPGQNSAVQDEDCLLPKPASGCAPSVVGGNGTLSNCCSICAANTRRQVGGGGADEAFPCNPNCNRIAGSSGTNTVCSANCRTAGQVAFGTTTCPACPTTGNCASATTTSCNGGAP